jgi:hypothetical protein
MAAFLGQRQPLHDAEFMLLINDDEAQAVDGEGIVEEGVGADGDGALAAEEAFQHGPIVERGAVAPLAGAGMEADRDAERL